MATYLLIHGAYQGGWIWKHVATRLRAKGHLVFAPSLDGCGERAGQIRAGITVESQAEELAKFLFTEDLTDVNIVGTSAGGMTLAKVAELARDRVGTLYLVDALSLFDGEKIRDIVTRPASINTDIALGPTREDAGGRLLKSLPTELAEWTLDRITLHPTLVFHQAVKLPTFWDQDWDAHVVFCHQAENPGIAHQRRAAERLKAHWHELDTGHYPMLSMPDELTQLLTDA
jgi:pimeloyl-ACP methyl ester carboxylesterase